MPILVEQLPAEPIVVVTFEEGTQIRGAIQPMLNEIIRLRDSMEDSVNRYFIIMDMTRYDFTFNNMVYTMGELKGVESLRRPDRPAYMMLVGIGGIIEMAVKALPQSQYGGYQSHLFLTFDEAVGAARKALVTNT